jgi:serine/threonine protein kinase
MIVVFKMCIQAMDNQYTILNQLGEGVFGYVWKAIHHPTKQIVAIKQLKDKSQKNEVELVEFQALKSLKGHPNIVELKNIIKQDNVLLYVFEYMKDNLLQVIKKQAQPLCEEKIKCWMYQILQATKYMHSKGYVHRDMKPENILVTGNLLKLADFGMAKKMCLHCYLIQTWTHLQYKHEDCSCGHFTDYVCTRWYRAPELLVHSQTYTSAIDMWSVGVIMAELFRSLPLFPGVNEQDQLYRICEVLGTPNHSIWPVGLKLARNSCFQFPQFPPLTTLAFCIPNASPEALNLIQSLCTWDPKKRLTASQALEHPFFKGNRNNLQFNQLFSPIDYETRCLQLVGKNLQHPKFVEEFSYPYHMQEVESKFPKSTKKLDCKHTNVLSLEGFYFQKPDNVLVNFQPDQQTFINLSNNTTTKKYPTYTFYSNYISSYKQACNSIKTTSTIG